MRGGVINGPERLHRYAAMGWNWKEAGRSAYFIDFLYAACSAAAAEEVEDAPT